MNNKNIKNETNMNYWPKNFIKNLLQSFATFYIEIKKIIILKK